MVWQPEINEIERRRRLAEQMGGPERIARQHKGGKLTVRERIAALADPGSFQEIGALAGKATYDGDNLVTVTPDGYVMGTCTLSDLKVMVVGGDFTIRGAPSVNIEDKTTFATKMALDFRLPLIRLLDAVGGSVSSVGPNAYAHVPDHPSYFMALQLLGVAPVVSAVMGAAAGGPAVESCLAHFNVMVKGTSQTFIAGPPVVKAALGYEISKEELGGERVHVYKSGVINNLAQDELEAFSQVRRFLSYMPQNVWEMPTYITPTDDPNRCDEELQSIIPRASNKPYDPYKLLSHVLDRNSVFEITPFYGRSRITALARVNGYPVGVMIDNPQFLGGSMNVAAAEKTIRFIQMCDTFHLPMVYFGDQPGFMVGIESEEEGLVRTGARVLCVTLASKMPWITFIIRQMYGVAGTLGHRPHLYQRYAWPSANWGSMHIEGGVMAAFRREIESAPDPEAKRQEIERRLKAVSSPFRTAEAFAISDIIDPRDTRPLLCAFIKDVQRVLQTQLGPVVGPSYLP